MSTLNEAVRPLGRTPERAQVAALCLRGSKKNREILMITSRDSGRWIVPKGWPMEGRTDAEAALQEAWEEAGVRGRTVSDEPIGAFAYDKVLDNGTAQPVRASVYQVEVRELADEFPERGQRKRRWMSPSAAANLVAETDLQNLLRAL